MKITWKITKKRGYPRPTLTYGISLNEYERALALPPMRVRSRIPEPLDSWQEHCYPGQHERAAQPQYGDMYDLDTPSHKGTHGSQSLRLPWREDNSYPEVEESFRILRDAFEAEVAKAYDSQPMNTEHSLEGTEQYRQYLAPGTVAERFLNFARKAAAAKMEGRSDLP